MKTEEILHYDRMYRAMREVLDADIITFGFWHPPQILRSRNLREDAGPDEGKTPPYTRLSAGESL